MRALLFIPFALTVLSACGNADGDVPPAPQTADPIIVSTLPVRDEDVIDPILATGEVRADKRTEIKPRVNGIIDAIHVHVGDSVTTGQPLFETRKVDYQTRVRELEHALVLARAEVTQAERDLNRARTLRERGVVSEGRMDSAITQHATATARLGIAEASLARAKQDLADAVVRAPYDGIVTERFVDEGTMVQVAASNTPVVEVVKVDVVEIIARVPATHLTSIRPGTPAAVDIDGLERPIKTTLDVINDKVDARTRSVEIRLRLDNPDHAIKPGLFAKVTLYPAATRATVVDRGAVLGLSGDNYVFVPASHDGGDIARRQTVKVRDIDAGRMEMLDGVEAGGLVLAGPNLPDLKDGAPIAIRPTAPTRQDAVDAPR